MAVWPPVEVRRHLRRRLGAAEGLTAVEKWHITLAFLGEVPEAQIPALTKVLETVAVPRGRPLRLRGGGEFNGRVTWAGVEGDLGDLNRNIRHAATRAGQAAVRLSEAGRSEAGRSGTRPAAFRAVADGRPFQAHLTVKYASDQAARGVLEGYEGPSWPLGEIALVRSGPGSFYTTLATW